MLALPTLSIIPINRMERILVPVLAWDLFRRSSSRDTMSPCRGLIVLVASVHRLITRVHSAKSEDRTLLRMYKILLVN